MFFDTQPGSITELPTGRSLGRGEIAAHAAAQIERFHAAGLGRGDRVFVLYGNNLEFFVDLLAVWHCGASLVPIDSRLTAYELENLARAVMPRFILTDSSADATSLARVTALGVRAIDIRDREDRRLPAAAQIRCQAYLDDEALILFTSGSTGIPKGVVHTHRSLRARWLSLRDSLGIDAFSRTLCLLPTHFGHGLICNSLFPWLAGQDLVIAPPFNMPALMQLGTLVDEHKITFLSSVPSMWALALKASRPPQSKTLRRVHCGSAPLSAHLWRQIQQWSGTNEVFNAYGITETGSWVAGTSVAAFVPEDGLIGVPWGAVVKILKRADAGAPFDAEVQCSAEEPGYIWLNTPALMRGYYGQPELTDQVISGGWFFTGDIGLVDQRGWLYLKGREREEINKGGAKIYPADIDAVVERFDGAKEACAFALEDPLYGQSAALAIVLQDDGTETIRDLHDWLKRHLADYKMPTRWYSVDSLPRNSRGKISRKDVAEFCAQREPLDLKNILKSQ